MVSINLASFNHIFQSNDHHEIRLLGRGPSYRYPSSFRRCSTTDIEPPVCRRCVLKAASGHIQCRKPHPLGVSDLLTLSSFSALFDVTPVPFTSLESLLFALLSLPFFVCLILFSLPFSLLSYVHRPSSSANSIPQIENAGVLMLVFERLMGVVFPMLVRQRRIRFDHSLTRCIGVEG